MKGPSHFFFFGLPSVLGTKAQSGQWEAHVLSSTHNGENPTEALKVQKQHPGEAECVLENRVLGAIAVTRGRL